MPSRKPYLAAFSCIGAALLVLSSACVARAASQESDDPDVHPLDTREFRAWDHVEVSMGFLAGQRHYGSTPWALSPDGAMAGASALVEPFQRAPYDKVTMFGVRYDARLVVSYVRMSVGFDLPFATNGLGDGGHYSIGGVDRDLSVRSIHAKDLRFGIGGEYPIGPFAPFVDLLGAIHWADTTLAVDGTSQTYDARTFAISVRAGARVHLRKWFFASAAGEVGVVGDVRWGAELAVGVAFP